MNATAALRPPWIASARSSRWLAAVGVAVLAVAEVLILILARARARDALTGVVWCCALALWWFLVVPNALWLGRDATVLRLPHLRHLANASVPAHALLTVGLPATVFALVLGHALVWYVGFTLAATGCLLFLLLPSGIWIVLWAAFVAVTDLHLLHFHPSGFDRLALDAAVPVLALVGLAAWLWFRLLDMQAPATVGLGKPVIWNLKVRSGWGFSGVFTRGADAALARNTRTWLAPAVDLRRVDPVHPVRAIRVALGRNLMPQTPASQLRILGLSVGLMVVFLTPSILQAMHGDFRHALSALLLLSGAGGITTASILAAVLPLTAVGMYGWPLQQRWSTPNGELSLLGLLPQLGDAPTVRRSAALACLVKAFQLAAFECVALCAIGWWLHAPASAFLLAVLSSVATVALTAAPVLGALGGRPLSGWLLAVLAIVTTGVGTAAVAVTLTPRGAGAATSAYLAAALLVLLAILATLGRRGWDALVRRPHPFLASTR